MILCALSLELTQHEVDLLAVAFEPLHILDNSKHDCDTHDLVLLLGRINRPLRQRDLDQFTGWLKVLADALDVESNEWLTQSNNLPEKSDEPNALIASPRQVALTLAASKKRQASLCEEALMLMMRLSENMRAATRQMRQHSEAINIELGRLLE